VPPDLMEYIGVLFAFFAAATFVWLVCRKDLKTYKHEKPPEHLDLPTLREFKPRDEEEAAPDEKPA
jgi:hypothetical protein